MPRQPPKPLAERFWSKVDKNGPTQPHMDTPCWVWTGAKAKGYGMIGNGRRGKNIYAHRAAIEIDDGPIPDGMQALHRCDNPPCVRRSHLFVGTRSDNMRDCCAKRRGNTVKLNHEQVDVIRLLGEATALTQKQIATVFSMNQTTDLGHPPWRRLANAPVGGTNGRPNPDRFDSSVAHRAGGDPSKVCSLPNGGVGRRSCWSPSSSGRTGETVRQHRAGDPWSDCRDARSGFEEEQRLVRALGLAVALLALPASAVDFKLGPSCPLVRIGLGTKPLELAPGLGLQAGATFGNWSVDSALFGSLVQGTTTDGRASLAVFACYSPLGACLGPVIDLATSAVGGIFSGFTWKQNFGLVAAISWEALSLLHYRTAHAIPLPGGP